MSTVADSLFDFTDFGTTLEKPTVPEYTGRAPLQFTVDYYSPDELDALAGHNRLVREMLRDAPFEEWRGALYAHSWRRGYGGNGYDDGTHSIDEFNADLRCSLFYWGESHDERDHKHRCFCVGELVSMIICERCQWHTVGTEDQAVAGWHDHAWPGWRNLPVQAGGLSDKRRKAEQPAEWHVPGAPIITRRSGIGTRSVPGRSPWKGYDLSHTILAAVERAS